MLLQNQGAGYGDGKVNLWKMKLYSIIHLPTYRVIDSKVENSGDHNQSRECITQFENFLQD